MGGQEPAGSQLAERDKARPKNVPKEKTTDKMDLPESSCHLPSMNEEARSLKWKVYWKCPIV